MELSAGRRSSAAFRGAEVRSFTQEVPDTLASPGVPVVAAHDVHVCMEDMLAARRPDISIRS